MVITRMTSAVIMCIITTIGISVVYFSRERVDNSENKIYRTLIICNIIGLVLHMVCDTMSFHYDSIPKFVSTFFYKTFLIYYFAFGAILLSYLFTICKFKYAKEMSKLMSYITLGLYIVIFFIPQQLYRNPKKMIFYTHGTDVQFIYVTCAIAIAFLFTLIIINLRSIEKRKMIPLFIFMVGATISVIIQHNFPDLVITDCFESTIVLLMYFTIENPDVRLIELLNKEREKADKANNAKTDFLSSMSHEIRTPLNAIDGFAQLMLEENDINVIKDEAKDIMSASQSLLEIVNGILDISKIEADKLEIVNVEYEPKKIFEDVAMLAKSRMKSDKVHFQEHIAQDLPDYLIGDYGRIKQIVLNLLTNAVKYTKEGIVDFSVRCVVNNQACRLIIVVKDTGIGIKKEDISKLFNKFERFDKEENFTIEGTGLGLAITKKLVELMHGKIIADSIYGKGSVFAVVIDQAVSQRKKDYVIDSLYDEEDKKIDFNNRRVLVVDDNKVNLKVASKLLETFGISCDCVSSGQECIDKLNNGFLYNLILMDDMMPKLSGVETFKLLKKNPDFSIPVIALTANAIEGMREYYIKQGFNDYISKPIDKKELERVLSIYLN